MSEFRPLRVAQAAHEIDTLTTALAWLREYGVQLSHRDKDTFDLTFRAIAAGACNGVREAEKQISAVARTKIKEIIEAAIRDAENTIVLNRAVIKEEADKP